MGDDGHGIVPILGTMTFGAEAQVKPDAVGMILRAFVGSGCTRTAKGALIDTGGFSSGTAEDTLGELFDTFPSLQRSTSVASKASANVKPHLSLSRKSVIEQCDASLDKLGLDCLDVFYLQAPDVNTDINDTLDGIAELHKEGKIAEFGLSNYPAWVVMDIWHRCKARSMVRPTVYQGMYNMLTRDLEREVVPVIRELGMRLYVYNPLAGGLLSGRYRTIADVEKATEGRFSEEFEKASGKAETLVYHERYAKPLIFEGLGVLRKACMPSEDMDCENQPKVVQDTTTVVDGRRVRLVVSETDTARPQGLDMANVALRWLLHHSYLRRGDGIILGVSKNTHLVANLAAWRGCPLESDLLEACNSAWEIARPACEPYFQGLGAKPGDIESFLKVKTTVTVQPSEAGYPSEKIAEADTPAQ